MRGRNQYGARKYSMKSSVLHIELMIRTPFCLIVTFVVLGFPDAENFAAVFV